MDGNGLIVRLSKEEGRKERKEERKDLQGWAAVLWELHVLRCTCHACTATCLENIWEKNMSGSITQALHSNCLNIPAMTLFPVVS